MKTALGSPCAFKTRFPVTASDEVDLYTPEVSVSPVMSDGLVASGARPAASLYAVVRSDCAWPATASVSWMLPFNVIDWEPVIAVPGLRPMSPLMVVGPVLVTVEAARTAKLFAVLSPTVAWLEATAGPAASTQTRISPPPIDPRPANSRACLITSHLRVGLGNRGVGLARACFGFPEGSAPDRDSGSRL